MATSLRGTVVQVHPSEVILKLEDGREGVLARREFTHLPTRDLRQTIRVNQEFHVIAETTEPAQGRVNVRLALDDEWEQLRRQYPPGAFLRGVVSGIESYGVFIDLLPGITGLAPTAELPHAWLDTSPPLLLGDFVRCSIQSVNRAERHVRLSLRSAATERVRALARAEAPPPAPNSFYPPLAPPKPRRALRILVVDNDEGLRAEIAEYLHARGHQVAQAASFADARARLNASYFEAVLLDIQLGDGSGLELAEELIQQTPRTRLLLMSDFTNLLSKQTALETMSALGVLFLNKHDYRNTLEALLNETPAPNPNAAPKAGTSLGETTHATLEWKLDKLLRELRRQTNASGLLLVHLDDTGQHLKILKSLGSLALDQAELQAHWRFSPLRDALEDGETIFAEDADAGHQATRFQYLQRALDFASVIGVQVPSEPRGALFVFHSTPRHFGKGQIHYVRSAAERAAAALEVEHIQQAVVDSQRYMLLGQLSATIVHEVTNKLGRVRSMAENLPGTLQELETKSRDGQTVDQLHALWLKAHNQSSRLDVASREISKMVNQFDTLSKQIEPQRYDVHEILENALEFSYQTASEAAVELHYQLQHPAPFCMVVAAWLQQAVLNTLLNAIQNFGTAPAKGTAHVLLETRAAPADAQHSLQIRICDNGPGIHTALLERIFQFGYTTRPGGSGIGLFISRRLIESMGGRIRVEESYPLWGTTFLIELPTVEVTRAAQTRA